jgi:hypothetical protein
MVMAKKERELKWQSIAKTPRNNSQIHFEHCGTVFEGTFHEIMVPWGTAWYISYTRFSRFMNRYPVTANEISRWAYSDGSA